jgi:hypothetical protein
MALPVGRLALSRVCRQGRGVGVHRSAAEILDGRSARSERRVSAGRAKEETKPLPGEIELAVNDGKVRGGTEDYFLPKGRQSRG